MSKRRLIRHMDSKHPQVYRLYRESLRQAHKRDHLNGVRHRKHSRSVA